MAVIKIKTVVGNLTEVQGIFTHIKIYRSTTGISGTYVEITGPATRLAIESGKVVYEYTDQAGSSSYYYKSSYYNSTSLLESSLSDPQQGEGDPALDIVSVAELKTNYLFGLDLTDDEGIPYPDSLYEWYIKGAVSYLEMYLDIPLRTLSIEDERHDFFREDYSKYMWVHLKHYPVLEVEEVRLVLPTGQEVINFDQSWFFLEKDSGQLQICPGQGNIAQLMLGMSGNWLPYFMGAARFIPQAFRVKYTAGFEPGKVPATIRELAGKLASYGPLNIAGDLVAGAGLAGQSLSIDGLSQSITTTNSSTNAGFGARLILYRKEVKDVLPVVRQYYKGNKMVVV